MGRWSAEQWAAAAGIVFVVLSVVGDVLPGGSYPKIDDDAATIAAFSRDHHRALLASSILTGAAAPFLVWLFAGVAGYMRGGGQGALASVAFGAIVAGSALATASDVLFQATPHIDDEGVIQGAFAIGGLFITKAFWFASVAALAVGLAAWRGAFARWYAWLVFAASVLFALGGMTVGSSGLFAVAGPMTFIAFIALMIWVVTTSVVLWKTPVRELSNVAPASV